MISLSKEEIESFQLKTVEEKIIYVRYMLNRETNPELILNYRYMLNLLQKRIPELKGAVS